tara:strand:+ start:1102 stop:1368 length:267 start_codon:yes stop_codon:yes gene_type:complete
MIKYTPKEIIQGEAIKREKEETAQTFHGDKSRMAGDVGEFAMKMMNDPVSIKQNQMWMNAFNMSNQGLQFNQAKMMMMGGNKPQEPGA